MRGSGSGSGSGSGTKGSSSLRKKRQRVDSEGSFLCSEDDFPPAAAHALSDEDDASELSLEIDLSDDDLADDKVLSAKKKRGRQKRKWELNEPFVALSNWDKCPLAQVSQQRMAVSGHKGFRSVRVNHGVRTGRWFCEMVVEKATKSEDEKVAGHVRVGWAQALARVDGPVGMCKLGYALRDVDGAKVHDGWRETYGKGFQEGDVIGMAIDLLLHERRRSVSGTENGGMKLASNKQQLETLTGSSIRFFKNGEDLGIAFTDLGMPDQFGYFATVSVYQNATVRFNPGPEFRFPPPEKFGFDPLCLAVPEESNSSTTQADETSSSA